MEEHIRSPLVRSMYAKLEHQRMHETSTHDEWYSINSALIEQKYMLERFISCQQDEETAKFLSKCFEKSDWVFTQFYHAIAKAVLTWFMTSTSINGLLRRGSMFVFSSAQFRTLIGYKDDQKAENLLDLGAGDGCVTSKMASSFQNVYVTEISPTMRWRLQEHGFKVIDIESWDSSVDSTTGLALPDYYDVVGCLNLLDRCDKPMSILRRITRILKPKTGRLVIALVLPLVQHVETTSSKRASEILDIRNSQSWEEQFCSFVQDILVPLNYELVRWTRLPYLCEGDFTQSFYYLNEIVMVLRYNQPRSS